MNITKGKWEISSYRPREIWVGADYHVATCHNLDSKETIRANAELITQAGNVANETGLTPRQLLEQRDKLLEALMLVLGDAEDDMPLYLLTKNGRKAKQAIAKAESD